MTMNTDYAVTRNHSSLFRHFSRLIPAVILFLTLPAWGEGTSENHSIEISPIATNQVQSISGDGVDQDTIPSVDEAVRSEGLFLEKAYKNDEKTSVQATEKSGDFEFSNLFNSCTLLATAFLGFMVAAFSAIRARE